MQEHHLNTINGPLMGLALKELVRRAIIIARRQRTSFEINNKLGYGGTMDDVFTTADTLAQESYVKLLTECYPDIGIIGEEDSLVIEGNSGLRRYFTIDPIDGTKAYIRRQSHGIGSMIALVTNETVESAYIGDINSQEIFGYRPGSHSAWRITDWETYERLENNPPSTEPDKLYLLLREREQIYGELSRETISLFKSVSIDGGSIGIWSARLWKGEVGGLLLNASWETPWDSSPVIGISKKLGYLFFEATERGWRRYEPIVSQSKYWRNHDTLIIHANQVEILAKHVPIIM